MKKIKSRIKSVCVAVLPLILTIIFVGCGKKECSDDFKKVVDEWGKITLNMDAESAVQDTVYESVAAYLETGDLTQLDQTMEEVKNAYFSLSDKYQYRTENPYEIPDDLTDMMKEYGIYEEDLLAYASEEEMTLENYLISLEGLYEYLSYEKTDVPMTEELTFYYEMVSKRQNIQRHYMYTGINYWFYDRSKEELAYVEETVTKKLLSFCSDGHEWDREQENVEDRMSAYLDELADLRLDWEIYLGEQEGELNRMRQGLMPY